MAMPGGGAVAAKRCMNPACGGPASSVVGAGGDWRKGWPLRSGGFALLCDKCGYDPTPPCPLRLSYAPPPSSCEWGGHLDWIGWVNWNWFMPFAFSSVLSPPLLRFDALRLCSPFSLLFFFHLMLYKGAAILRIIRP